jgi:uncharacterized protein YggE
VLVAVRDAQQKAADLAKSGNVEVDGRAQPSIQDAVLACRR